MSKAKHVYRRRMQFYETDAMGIIHHARYLPLFEEARLVFLRDLHEQGEGNLLEHINYPLVDCEIQFKKPLHFNEEVEVEFEVSTEKARLIFKYALKTNSFDKPVAFGKTTHVAFDMKSKKPVKLPQALLQYLES